MCASAWGFALHLVISTICPLLLQLTLTNSDRCFSSIWCLLPQHKKRHRKVKQLYISYTEGQNVLWADANNRGNTNGSARKPWILKHKNFKSGARESWQTRAQHSEKAQKWGKMDSERWVRMTHKIEETLEKILAVFVWQQPVEEPQGHANER